MGWWRIDPKTGKPAGQSKLSTSDVAVLNAVPGVDVGSDVFYLGDGAGDMVSESVRIIRGIIGKRSVPAEEARMLFAEEILPPALADLKPKEMETILNELATLWKDLDGCYEDDWSRGVKPEEKRWLVEYGVDRLCKANES